MKLMTNEPSPGSKVGPKHLQMSLSLTVIFISCNRKFTSILTYSLHLFYGFHCVQVSGSPGGRGQVGPEPGSQERQEADHSPSQESQVCFTIFTCLNTIFIDIHNLLHVQAVSGAGEQQSSPSPGLATFYSGSLPQEPLRC